MADGGDGMLEILEHLWRPQQQVERHRLRVTGPRGKQVTAALLWLPAERTAAIEMALASGLALLGPTERDPLHTTTWGTGECLRAALDLGARRILIGLGGSATHDGGMGAASALGYRFLDARGQQLPPMGASLNQVARIDASGADPRLHTADIIAIRDVANPLCGPQGAAAIYAPQKGARPDQIPMLDAGLRQLAECYARDLGQKVAEQPGSGAAGGLGAGLLACCNARLEPGASYLLDLAGFAERLQESDLVLTAEGQVDASSLQGKATGVIAARAAAAAVPCIAIAGRLPSSASERQALHHAGLTALFSLCPGPMTLAQAEAEVGELLATATEDVIRLWLSAHPREKPWAPRPDVGGRAIGERELLSLPWHISHAHGGVASSC
ncbi:Glycerate kinase [Thiorhodovibrio winogradskyi]|uniref:Glycerate kinase n=2 Tax=Thiorhodovibrio winogradskyi TaxID=77007 RepID=A0ABZ0S2B2_9GAMM